MDEFVANEVREIQVSSSRVVFEILQTNFLLSALGLSHALGHKLGAAYGIPHGITSVRLQ